MAKFHGNTRGLIRGLLKRVKSVQAADVRAQAAADAKGTIPVLFGASDVVTSALSNLEARCNAALSQP